MINLSTEQSGAYTRISVSGEVDFSTTQRLINTVGESFDAGAQVIDVEMADVDFIDSTGIGGLVRLSKRSSTINVSFRLLNCSPRTRDILRLTGLDSILTLVSEDEP